MTLENIFIVAVCTSIFWLLVVFLRGWKTSRDHFTTFATDLSLNTYLTNIKRYGGFLDSDGMMAPIELSVEPIRDGGWSFSLQVPSHVKSQIGWKQIDDALSEEENVFEV